MGFTQTSDFESIQKHQEAMNALRMQPVAAYALHQALSVHEIPKPAPNQVTAENPSSWMIAGLP